MWAEGNGHARSLSSEGYQSARQLNLRELGVPILTAGAALREAVLPR